MIKDGHIRSQQCARGDAVGARTPMVVIDAMIIKKNTHAHNDDVRATAPEGHMR